MSLQHVNTISTSLSLHPPQRDWLKILASICDIVSLGSVVLSDTD